MNGKLKYYVMLLRPLNLLIISVTMLLFIFKADNFNIQNIRNPEYIFVILAVMFTAAGGYIINDIFDIEADNINRPHKRIIATRIPIRNANIFYACLLALSIVFGFFIGLGMGFLVMAVNLLLYYYSSDLKGTVLYGNLLVAFLSGMVVYTAAYGVFTVKHAYFSEYALLAFFISMARELMKDVEDMEGDKAQQYHTFPIMMGVRYSKVLAQFFLLAVVADLVYLFTLAKSMYFMLYVSVLVLVPLAFTAYLIFKASEIKEFRRISAYLKLIMILGLVSVLLTD